MTQLDITQRECPLCHGAGHVDQDDPTANRIGRWNQDGQATQRGAAIDNYPRSGSQRARILMLLEATPATSDEIEAALGIPHQSASARINDLLNGGWILDTGQRRRTRSGSLAIAWTASDQAYTQR